MTGELFNPFSDLQSTRLAKLGNPLLELDSQIDWHLFRPVLGRIYHKKRRSNAGAKAKDVVMMFKGLVLQNLYGLSDDQLEYQIQDRLSFRQFMGLSPTQRVPDAKTFWAFRNQLTEHKLVDNLFEQFSEQLNKAGFIARKGQMIDASIIPAPIQRNTRDENQQIKSGEIPEDWSKNKRSQKDTDARWTKKNGKNHYGYKNHIEVDNAHKLIRKFQTTASNKHDSKVFEDLLDANNTSKDVWADSAYRSKDKEAFLDQSGYRSKIQRKGTRTKPLTNWERQGNKTRSRVRSRVEHIFGAQSQLRAKAVRCIGATRTHMEIGMMNLVYNMRRLCFLKRSIAS
jgi:IS5 family transposase